MANPYQPLDAETDYRSPIQPWINVAAAHPDDRTQMVVQRAVADEKQRRDEVARNWIQEDIAKTAMELAQTQGGLESLQKQMFAQQAPQMPTQVTPTTAEGLAGLIGGLATHDFAGAATNTMNSANARQQKEYANSASQFEQQQAKQKMSLQALLSKQGDLSSGLDTLRQMQFRQDQQNADWNREDQQIQAKYQHESQMEQSKSENRLKLQELVNQGKVDQKNLAMQFASAKNEFMRMAQAGEIDPSQIPTDDELFDLIASNQIKQLSQGEAAKQNAETRAKEVDRKTDWDEFRMKYYPERDRAKLDQQWKIAQFNADQAMNRLSMTQDRIDSRTSFTQGQMNQRQRVQVGKENAKSLNAYVKTLSTEKGKMMKKGMELRAAITKSTDENERKALQGQLGELQKYVRDYLDPQINKYRAAAEEATGPFDAAPESRGKQSGNWKDLKGFADSHGFTVTSTMGGKHNKGSKHYQGLAVDVRTRDKTESQIQAFIRECRARGIRVLDERTRPAGQAVWGGPHLHLEY